MRFTDDATHCCHRLEIGLAACVRLKTPALLARDPFEMAWVCDLEGRICLACLEGPPLPPALHTASPEALAAAASTGALPTSAGDRRHLERALASAEVFLAWA